MKKTSKPSNIQTCEHQNPKTSQPLNLSTSQPYCLTIAASDTSGDAGIQRDIKTFYDIGITGLSVITGITAQTHKNVSYAQSLPAEQVQKQLETIFENYHISGVKTGVVFSVEVMRCVADYLHKYNPQNIIIDPILSASDEYSFLDEEGFLFMRNSFLNAADIITPNVPELENLSEISIFTKDDLLKAGKQLSQKYNAYIFVKGGHFIVDDVVMDHLIKGDEVHTFANSDQHLSSIHGTGCLISSAITSYLALGYDIKTAISRAKEYFYSVVLK